MKRKKNPLCNFFPFSQDRRILWTVVALASLSFLSGCGMKGEEGLSRLPNQQGEGSGAETGPSNNPKPPQKAATLETDDIIGIFPILQHQKTYYLKGGDLWVADVATRPFRPQVLLDVKDPILAFDLSKDQKLVAYSVRHGRSESPWAIHGDTLLVRNLDTGKEFQLYSADPQKDLGIIGIRFSPDGRQLLFTNNSIWVADLATRHPQSHETLDPSQHCPLYDFQDISPDGTHALMWTLCDEGRGLFLFDIRLGQKKELPNPRPDLIGFINDHLLLGYEYRFPDQPDPDGNSFATGEKMGAYDLSFRLSRRIEEADFSDIPSGTDEQNPDSFLYFDNQSAADTIYLSPPSPQGTFGDQTLYELDPKRLSVKKTMSKKAILVILNRPKDNLTSLWLTNTALENPTRIDQVSDIDVTHSPSMNIFSR